jgi:hypothetical protein
MKKLLDETTQTVDMARRLLSSSRFTMLLVAFVIVFAASLPIIKASPAEAATWAGWDNINTIYYDPAQDDPVNEFLETAATEIRDHLLKTGKTLTITTASRPDSGSIYLEVNAALPALSGMNDEAFQLLADSDGIYITGKIPIAVREGAYTLLEKLGFRWFFKSNIWDVTPDSLPSLDGLNEVQQPSYIYRAFQLPVHNGMTATKSWLLRNKMIGASGYQVKHTYIYIRNYNTGWNSMTSQERLDFYNANPTMFLPEGQYPSGSWQLNPYDQTVINNAIGYANAALANGIDTWVYHADQLPRGCVSISPNDGRGWDPPWNDDNNQEEITNAVYSLANDVAANIASTYPGKLVGVYSYSVYSMVPTIDLEPNILAMVATGYNYSNQTIIERVAGLAEKGIQVGIRDYIDIWQWWYDKPSNSMSTASEIQMYHTLGARYYNGETMDNWGGRGLLQYVVSKVLWDTSLNINDVMNDFYTKAFGPAADVMEDYYNTRSASDANLAESFRLLDEAEGLTQDEEILQRIRYLEAYNYFVWKFLNIGLAELSNSELEDFYTFVTKTRDWCICSYDPLEESVRDELISRGYSSGAVDALEDFVVPTSGDISGWMAEALAEWGDVPGPLPPDTPNPAGLELQALGDTASEAFVPVHGLDNTLTLPLDTGETATMKVKGNYSNVKWYTPTGMRIDSYTFNGAEDWTTVTFNAPMSGNYKCIFDQSSDLYIDCPDRPASLIATQDTPIEFSFSYDGYFYVPEGTSSFSLGISTPAYQRTVTATLTDPGNNTFNFSYTQGGTETENLINSPEPGLWKIEADVNTDIMSWYGLIWLKGIPPLVWHDPQYLLVPGDGYTPPPAVNHAPVLNPIGTKSVLEEETLQFTVSASDSDDDPLTYSASNLPSGATFNTATRVFSWTPTADQVGTYDGVRFSVSDGTSTDFENITIRVTPDQNGRADINEDGTINILDVIRIIKHFGETGANSWIPEDVNDDGVIDILDFSFIIIHCTG